MNDCEVKVDNSDKILEQKVSRNINRFKKGKKLI